MTNNNVNVTPWGVVAQTSGTATWHYVQRTVNGEPDIYRVRFANPDDAAKRAAKLNDRGTGWVSPEWMTERSSTGPTAC